MAFRVQRKQNVSIKKVVVKIFATVLVLYVGGQLLTQLGTSMNGTSSPFYPGLSLIGWTVGSQVNTSAAPCYASTTCITATNGIGILTVVGLVGIASVILEFVEVSF